MKNMMLAMLVFAGLAMGQSVASKDPVTVSTDIYQWKSEYLPGSTMVTVHTNCSDMDATHFIISLNWQAGSSAGAETRVVKRNIYGAAYFYVMVNADVKDVVVPTVRVTPVKIQAMSTAQVTANGKEYVEP